jgi:hypothetical protein
LGAAIVVWWLVGSVQAQYFVAPGSRIQRRTVGTYGPRMSFGQFGYAMNYGEAFGNPYGGLDWLGFGFGYGIGPQFGPGGSVIYSSAYTTPGVPPSGFYPPFAAYGWTYQNPATFGPGSPGFTRPRSPYPYVPRGYVRGAR